MKSVSDEQLMASYLQGDEQAFAELVKRYERELFNYLYKYSGQAGMAEEIFQETFFQVHLAAEHFDLQRRFKPWLYTIATNKARDALRKQARRPAVSISAFDDQAAEQDLWDVLVQDDQTPDRILDQKQQHQRVREIIAGMPEHLREILLLGYFEQLSYKEIADILNVPLGTVKSRLHAAVAFFAKQFKSPNARDSE